MKIGVDCDDVLAVFVSNLAEELYTRFGLDFSKEKLTPSFSYLDELLGDNAYVLSELLTDSNYILGMNVVEGVRKGIEELVFSGNELYVITARVVTPYLYTVTWLENNFGKVFSEVFYSGERKIGRCSKGEIAKLLELDLHIDDNSEHIENVSSFGIQTVVFGDYHWNQEVKGGSLIKRANSWPELVDYVKSLEE